MDKKINIFILEDDIIRIESFNEILSSYKNVEVHYESEAINAIKYLDENNPDIMFLDHDLGNRQFVDTRDINTGSEVVRHIIKTPKKYKNTIFVIHSFNPIAANNMVKTLKENINNNVSYIQGVWIKDIFERNVRID